MDGRTSPLKAKSTKSGNTRTSGRQTKLDDGSTTVKPHPPGRRTQPPVHLRVANKDVPHIGIIPVHGAPRRTRSNPSYTSTPATRHAHLLPSLPSKATGETSPSLQHKQSSTVGVAQRGGLQHSQSVPSQILDPAKQKLVDRAIKARLYFLRKSGPNRFLVGGDSLDSRFHVTIGPQSCSCNKSHCVHILFVMLRVFKVSQNDPNLWRKPLLNYEAEGLLKDFQTRLSQRTTPRKSNKKSCTLDRAQSLVEKIDTPTSSNNLPGIAELTTSGSSKKGEDDQASSSSPAPSQEPLVKDVGSEGVTGEDGDSEKSEGEEEVCPICLNELDEGEDLLVCSDGCHNQLHQHCMDIWAGEQIKKKEEVYCPVCRAPWHYSGPASLTSPSTSIQEGVAEGGVTSSKINSPGHVILSDDKKHLYDQLKSMFGEGAAEDLFSSDWKHREAALVLLSRESISYLLPHVTAKFQSRQESGEEEKSAHAVQEVCMDVVTHAANDSVLKVFLASLELLRVILGYSVCYNAKEAKKFQNLLKPVLPVLLTRCADAQRRVKECSIDTACNLCLGQEGPLSVGSCCGHQASCGISNVRLILTAMLEYGTESNHPWNWWLGRLTLMEKLLTRFSWEFLLPQCMLKPLSPDHSVVDSDTDDSHSGTMSDVVSLDSATSSIVSASVPEANSPELTDANSNLEPGHMETKSGNSSTPGTELVLSEGSPDSMSPIVKNNLLMQCWYFAARATHVSHNKIAKVSRRVIVRIAKILRDDPSSLEIIHDVITKCHRTTAEGLLDKMLQAREKPQESMVPKKSNSLTKSDHKMVQRRQLHSPSHPVIPVQRQPLGPNLEPRNLSRELSDDSSFSLSDVDVEQSLSLLAARHSPPRSRGDASPRSHGDASPRSHGDASPCSQLSLTEDLVPVLEVSCEDSDHSEDSFLSAVSELNSTLQGEQIQDKISEGTEEGSSSTSNSHDSRSGDHLLHSDSRESIASGVGVAGSGVTFGDIKKTLNSMRQQPYYTRQSTIDSAMGSEFDSSSLDSASGIFQCKVNIEQEEAEALAKVRSMVPEDPPHPSLSSLVLPSEEVLVYVQPTVGKEKSEETDSYNVKPYIEGVHWKKGKVIGTGAFCTCHLARDLENGTMFAVKQVSYVRNTKEQEEDELTRLREEIAMLGRLSHPNIVRCLGATQQEGHINIFVEWMAGGCLDNILSEFGPLKEGVICNYTKQVCLGIAYLHDNHIIHRDLKGGNILLDSTGRRIRIADFGSSARLAANTTGPGEFQDMEGTVAFMAPEVVRGGTNSSDDSAPPTGYGRKCDVWSIGCVVIQMVTAKPPWVGTYDVRNKFQLIFRIGQATAPPPLPSFSNPGLKDLTIRCLEITPSDRPTSSELLKHPLFADIST